ncbi:MAG: hypothetical protein WEC59_09110 [Salibacteraceae bacterium]
MLLVLSIHAGAFSGRFTYEDFTKSDIAELVTELSSRDVSVVFCENYMLQWQIMAYSQGSIVCRSKQLKDRVSAVRQKADQVYSDNPSQSAWVDFTNPNDTKRKSEVSWFNHAFLLQISPEKDWLKHRGFQGI